MQSQHQILLNQYLLAWNLLILSKLTNALNINTKKATEFHIILPKLVKLSAEILSTPLSIVINNSLKYRLFTDHAKNASVIPLDKGKPNKNEISNFRPANILNTFLKKYEKVI